MEITVIDYEQSSLDYQRIEHAIRFLEENYERQPSLSEAAASVHLSEYHFQRLFQRWVGVSPKRFLQHLTKERAKQLLRGSKSLLDASYQSGLSGPGRLHDLFITWEAATPGQYKKRGEGMDINYGFHPTPFGQCLIAATDRGVCDLRFVEDNDPQKSLQHLKACWPQANFQAVPGRTSTITQKVFSAFYQDNLTGRLPVHVYGTNFQLKVWEALLRIPPGSVITYQDIAVQIGLPEGSRAVGNAVGHNPLPVLIPCHRVIRKDGNFGGYRFGSPRKKAILGWEFTRSSSFETARIPA